MIVTDPGILQAGLLEGVKSSLSAADVPFFIFDQVEPNPRHTTVNRAAEVFNEEGANLLIAVGGGSVMDSAKAIGVVAKYGGQVADYDGKDMVPGPIPPLIAIPTTSGTGSEVTIWAVITDVEAHYKMSIGDYKIYPAVALVDPEMTYSLPRGLTIGTALDALTHAIEAYTCKLPNPMSDALALQAIKLIARHLPRAAENGHDKKARSGLALGSMLAGMAFSNARVAAVHTLAETMGGYYDGPHGMLCGLLLPYATAFNTNEDPERHADIAQAMGAEARPELAARVIYDFADSLGVPNISEYGLSTENISQLAEVCFNNSSTSGNKRAIGKDDYAAILKQTLAWERPA
jgi:alcohol dehydrogenase